MALAPFTGERAVKEILLVKALPLRVVLLYRTAGWNARLFRKSLCKRLCKSLKTLSSAGGRPFRRSSGVPLEARFTPSKDVGSGRLRRPGVPVFTGENKRGQGHHMVPFPPLDSPKPSFAPRRPSVARLNGSYGGSVPGVVSLMGRMAALRSACVNRSAVSARPFGAGRKRRRCGRQA